MYLFLELISLSLFRIVQVLLTHLLIVHSLVDKARSLPEAHTLILRSLFLAQLTEISRPFLFDEHQKGRIIETLIVVVFEIARATLP